jgi:outer membrane protein TolC
MSALEAKASQIVAKRRMTEDKITTEVQATFAALTAARERVVQAREAVRLAKYMAEVEQKKFDNGSSDLLSVNLREQQAAEAAETEVDALLEYFQAQAVYRAALARDNDDGYLCP